MQVLQRRWDRTFSEHSHGFRPGRSAHQAVAQAQQYIAEGHVWCVDLDLEKFFDRVAKRVEDKRLLKLIRAFLNAGVMENGLVLRQFVVRAVKEWRYAPCRLNGEAVEVKTEIDVPFTLNQ
jgi:retron-type reverse transcriptase